MLGATEFLCVDTTQCKAATSASRIAAARSLWASIGPPDCSGGNFLTEGNEGNKDYKLQWGRLIAQAETDCSCSDRTSPARLQWGRLIAQAETGAKDAGEASENAGFNGAA